MDEILCFRWATRGYGFVKLGNLLAARCCLLILLAICRGLIFVLEQPDGSAFPFHPRWQEVIMHNKVTHSNDTVDGKILHHQRCPKTIFQPHKKRVSGITSGAGFFSCFFNNSSIAKYLEVGKYMQMIKCSRVIQNVHTTVASHVRLPVT